MLIRVICLFIYANASLNNSMQYVLYLWQKYSALFKAKCFFKRLRQEKELIL